MSTDNWWTEGLKARGAAKELNEIAKRKGLMVTFESTGDAAGLAAGHRFWVKGEHSSANTAQPFGTAEEVEAYLADFPDT